MKLHVRAVLLTIAVALVASVSSAQPITIDGVFNPLEWSRAQVHSLIVNVPGGGATSGMLYLWNDANNLYVAVVYTRTALDPTTRITIQFDSPEVDGSIGDGDDMIELLHWASCPPSRDFADVFRFSGPPCLWPFCEFPDTLVGGTSEGSGAVGNDGTLSVHELWHPLASNDVKHDIQVGRGMKLAFTLRIRLQDAAGFTFDTYYPGPHSLARYPVVP